MATNASFEVQLAVNAKEFIANLKAAQQAWAAFAGRLQENQGALWNTTVLGLQMAWSGKSMTTALAQAAKQADVFRINLLSLEQAAKNVGEGLLEVNQAAIQVSRDLAVPLETVSMALAMLLRRGYGIDQATELLYRFADAAVNIGKDIDQGILRGAQAVAQELSRLLNEMGIPENISDAIRDYAQNLGLASTALTDSQRRAAIFNMIMTSTSDKVGLANVALGGFVGSVQRLRNEFAIFIREFGKGVGAFFSPLIEGARLLLAAINSLPPQLRQVLGFLSALTASFSLVSGIALLTLSNVQRFISTVGSTIAGAIQAVKEFVAVWRETRRSIEAFASEGQGIFAPFLRSLGLVNADIAKFRRQIATMEAASPFKQEGVSAIFIPSLDFRKGVFGTYTQFSSISRRIAGDIDVLQEAFRKLQEAGATEAIPSLKSLSKAMLDVASSAGVASMGALGFFEVLRKGGVGLLGADDLTKANSTLKQLKDELGALSRDLGLALSASLSAAELNKRITTLQALNATIAKLGISLEGLPKPAGKAAQAIEALGIAAASPITMLNRFIRLVQSGDFKDPIKQRQVVEASRYFAMLGQRLENLKKTRFWDALVDDEAFEKFRRLRIEGVDKVDEAINRLLERVREDRPLSPSQMMDLAAFQVAATQVEHLANRLRNALLDSADPKEIRTRYKELSVAIYDVVRALEASDPQGKNESIRRRIEDIVAAMQALEVTTAKVSQSFPSAMLPFPLGQAERRALRKFVDEYSAAIAELIPTLRERMRLAMRGVDLLAISPEMTKEKLEELKAIVSSALVSATAAMSMGVRTSVSKLLPITIEEFTNMVADVFREAGIRANVLFDEIFALRDPKQLVQPEELLVALRGIELVSERTKEKVIIDLREIAAEAKTSPERAAQALTALFASLDKQADKFMLAQARAIESTSLIVATMASSMANLADRIGLNKLGEAIRKAFDATTLVAFASALDATAARTAGTLATLRAQLVALGAATQAALSSMLMAPIGKQGATQATQAQGVFASLGASLIAMATSVGQRFMAFIRMAISGVGQLMVALQALSNLVGGALVGSFLLLASVPVLRVSFFNAIGGAIALLVGTFKGLYNATSALVITLKDVGRSAIESIPGVNALAWAVGTLSKMFSVGAQSIGDMLRILGAELERAGKRLKLSALLRIPEGMRSPLQELEIFNLQRELARLEKQTDTLFSKLERRWRQAFSPRDINFERYITDQIKGIIAGIDEVEQKMSTGGLGAKEAEKAYDAILKRIGELRQQLLDMSERIKIPGLDSLLAQLSALEGRTRKGLEGLTPFLEELRKFSEDIGQLEIRIQIANAPEARRDIEQLKLDLAKALERVEFADNLLPKDKEALKGTYKALFDELKRIAEQDFVREFNRILSQGRQEIERTLLETIRSPMARLHKEMQLEIQAIREETQEFVRRYGEGTPEAMAIMAQSEERIVAVRKAFLERMRQQALEEQRILRELRISIAQELLGLRNQYINTYSEIINNQRRIAESLSEMAQAKLATGFRREQVFGDIFPDQAQVRQAEVALENLKRILADYRASIQGLFAMRKDALMAEWQLALSEAHNEFINRYNELENQISDAKQLAEVRLQLQQAYNQKIATIQKNYSAQLVALNQQLQAELLTIDQQTNQARIALQEAQLAALEARQQRYVQNVASFARELRQSMELVTQWDVGADSLLPLVESFRYVRDEANRFAMDSKATASALASLRQEASALGMELVNALVNAVRGARDALQSLKEAIKDARTSLMAQADASIFRALTSGLPPDVADKLVVTLKQARDAITGLGQAADNTFRQALVGEITRQSDAIVGLGRTYENAKQAVDKLRSALWDMGLTTDRAISEAANRYDALKNRLAGVNNQIERLQSLATKDAKAARELANLQAERARILEGMAKSATAREFLTLSSQLGGLEATMRQLASSVKMPEDALVRLRAQVALGALEVEYLRKQAELLNKTMTDQERTVAEANLALWYQTEVLRILNERNQQLNQQGKLTLDDERELADASVRHAESRERLTKAVSQQAESLYRLVVAMNDLKRAEMDYAEAKAEADAIVAGVEGDSIAKAQKELELADLRLENMAKRLGLAQQEMQVVASDEERAQALRNLGQAELEYVRALEARQRALANLVQAQEEALQGQMRLQRLFGLLGGQSLEPMYNLVGALGKVNILMANIGDATGEVAETMRRQLVEALTDLVSEFYRFFDATLEARTRLGQISKEFLDAVGTRLGPGERLEVLLEPVNALLDVLQALGVSLDEALRSLPIETLNKALEVALDTLRQVRQEAKSVAMALGDMVSYFDTGAFAFGGLRVLVDLVQKLGIGLGDVVALVDTGFSRLVGRTESFSNSTDEALRIYKRAYDFIASAPEIASESIDGALRLNAQYVAKALERSVDGFLKVLDPTSFLGAFILPLHSAIRNEVGFIERNLQGALANIERMSEATSAKLAIFRELLPRATTAEEYASVLDKIAQANLELNGLERKRAEAILSGAEAYRAQADKLREIGRLLAEQAKSYRDLATEINRYLNNVKETPQIIAESLRQAISAKDIDKVMELSRKLMQTGARSFTIRSVLEDAQRLLEAEAKAKELGAQVVEGWAKRMDEMATSLASQAKAIATSLASINWADIFPSAEAMQGASTFAQVLTALSGAYDKVSDLAQNIYGNVVVKQQDMVNALMSQLKPMAQTVAQTISMALADGLKNFGPVEIPVVPIFQIREPLEAQVRVSLDTEALRQALQQAIAQAAVEPEVIFNANITNNVNLEALGKELYERIKGEVLREVQRAFDSLGGK